MVETKPQDTVRPLKGRRMLVLGASSGFGRNIMRALNSVGAQVVVADTNAEGLARIDGAIPLALKGLPEDALRRAGRAWGQARLDGVLNLMPLRHPAAIDMNIAVLQSIVQGFMPALSARQGQIVTVMARSEQLLEIVAGAMAPAMLSAQTALAHALRRDGLSLNLVNMGDGVVSPARSVIVGLLSGALGSVTGSELRL